MHLDPQLMRTIALAFFILLVFSSRMSKGSVKQTPEGPAFPIKPLFAISRWLLLIVYIGLVASLSIMHVSKVPPVWVLAILVAVIALVVSRMPGTIVLTPTAVVQRFWFFKEKQIPYIEVMAVSVSQAGRATRVMGSNRVTILHTPNHSAAEAFRSELELRTGKKAVL
ncbi:hypothetical protein [Terriglobus tenax]|uniref:hypothetical protein n=1 Tax=Terriglobus tenax TaxID=1111115 RepID=UPI0021E09E30|nr:hypothetical protein [Terriglobus tenax]